MSFHRNAKLGLAGRYALVYAVESRMTLKADAVVSETSQVFHVPPLQQV